MARVKPNSFGVCFIVHRVGDQKDTWSKAFRFCGNAEQCYRELEVVAPGMRGRLEITKYDNGKPVSSYQLESVSVASQDR